MMKRLIPLLFIFLMACKDKLPEVPAGVIPMGKMQHILADMHVADAVAQNRAQMGMNEKLLTEEYMVQVYSNYHITRDEFLKSYKFYEANPILMNIMYDSILDDLSKREEAVGKKK